FVPDASSPPGLPSVHMKPTPENGRLQVLVHRRDQLVARLHAQPGAPPTSRMPHKIAAENLILKAQHELAAAQSELDRLLATGTDRHPSVISARQRVTAATQRLHDAQAALPPDSAPDIAATEDR